VADLIIREADGWEELEDVETAIADGSLEIEDLWKAAGTHDAEECQAILESAGWEWEEGDEIDAVKLIEEPDDILGQHTRIWVKLADEEPEPASAPPVPTAKAKEKKK
jgi:hypothetical protein